MLLSSSSSSTERAMIAHFKLMSVNNGQRIASYPGPISSNEVVNVVKW